MQIQISSRVLGESNYVIYSLKWKSLWRPPCLLVCNWFYWDRAFRSTVQILCQMHDNIIPFQWEYIARNNVAGTVSFITNYISNLCLECFNDHKLRITLLCLNFLSTTKIAKSPLKVTQESCLLRGHERQFRSGKCISQLSLPTPALLDNSL